MHEQRVDRVADAVPARLRIVDDCHGLIEVEVRVNINLHNSIAVCDDRHRGLAPDVVDELRAAAWHHEVDQVVHLEQFVDVRAVGVADHLHGIAGDARAGECALQQFAERGVAVPRFLAAAQDRRVAALQREHRDVNRHIRPRFVNTGDDAQRHAAAR